MGSSLIPLTNIKTKLEMEKLLDDKTKVNKELDEYDVIYEIERPFIENE